MIATENCGGICRADLKKERKKEAVEELQERKTTGTPLCCTRGRQNSKDLKAK